MCNEYEIFDKTLSEGVTFAPSFKTWWKFLNRNYITISKWIQKIFVPCFRIIKNSYNEFILIPEDTSI